MPKKIVLGTRGSELARWQARWVVEHLQGLHPEISIHVRLVKTTGDKMQDVALARLGGKGLFTKELEISLLRGDIDLAVHSLKDVPTSLPDGLALAAITQREDPRDVFLSRQGTRLSELAAGATVGTSSLRRQAQLRHWRADLQMVELRGNLATRWRKMVERQLDGIVLASAGVCRLGWEDRITEFLPPEVCLSAVGQGALALETRGDDAELRAMLQPLHAPATAVATQAERSFLEELEGGCQVPIAALGTLNGDQLTLQGMVASLDGRWLIRDAVTGPAEQTGELGKRLARELLERGAAAILAEIRATGGNQ